jgi:hypothetical protein
MAEQYLEMWNSEVYVAHQNKRPVDEKIKKTMIDILERGLSSSPIGENKNGRQ